MNYKRVSTVGIFAVAGMAALMIMLSQSNPLDSGRLGSIGGAIDALPPSEAGIQIGDVVEIKFAHKSNPRYFPVKEVTRVTQFVAGKDEMLAKDFERRIVARNRHGAATPDWLARARTAPASSPDPAAPTTTASASR